MTHKQTEDRIHTNCHAVKFYGNDDSLFSTVGAFISEGLVAGQPALLIATPGHTSAIVQQLRERLIDVDRALANGELTLLDAEEVLAAFMRGDSPDPEAFEAQVGSAIERSMGARERVVIRAYGEMVDVLWKQGRSDAAIQLEILWNKLAVKYRFSLLCGYSMGNFYKQAEQFHAVCSQHSHVLDPQPNVTMLERKRARRTA